MPYSDYRPDLMGSAALTPSGSFEAGSLQSFTLVYTAGAFGVDDTGSIKIGFRFATDFGPVQFTDPKGQGYTTVEASNGATLEAKWEFKRNIRPWSRSLYIGVVKDFLAPGDTITIRFGDRRLGLAGHPPADLLRERIRVPRVRRSDRHLRLRRAARKPADRRSCRARRALARRAADLGARGRAVPACRSRRTTSGATRPIASIAPCGCEAEARRLPACRTRCAFATGQFRRSRRRVCASRIRETLRSACSTSRATSCAAPTRCASCAKDTPLVHFWGDTHGQSNETLGTNTAREYFEFGRDKAFLDVIGHQGNDFQITGAFWRELNAPATEFDEPGRFVCIPGYEWSANTAVGGDRNVHYRHEGETIHRSSHAQIADATDIADEASDAHTAHELFEKLKGKDCVVMAHVGGRYADIKFAHDPLETAVEVHSAWGTFEWIVRDAFEKNYRVGIVGNSDGHKGRPGACYPGASFFGSYGRTHLLPGRAARPRRHLRVDAAPPALRDHRQPRLCRASRPSWQRCRSVRARSGGWVQPSRSKRGG